MPKVSDEHKADVRRQLLDAAHTCLSRNGFQDVTTRELLVEANLSTGTFYNYFPTKEHLYEALAEELLSADVERLRHSFTDGQTGPRLIDFVTRHVLTPSNAGVALAGFRSRIAGEDALGAIRRLNGWMVESFRPLVEQADAEGTLTDGLSPDALIELLDVVWDGMGRRQAQGSFYTSFDEVAEALLTVLTQGAVRTPPGRPDDQPRGVAG